MAQRHPSATKPKATAAAVPGEWLLAGDPIEINAGRRKVRLSVRNTGDRPIQVGSHFHFFEVNRVLEFDRPTALGTRLDVPSGQSIRFEAGQERDVDLVELGGSMRVIGFNALVDGAVQAPGAARRAIGRAAERGFCQLDATAAATTDGAHKESLK